MIKLTKESWVIIILAAIIVLVILMFVRRPSAVQTNYAELNKAHEEVYKAKDELILHLKKDNSELTQEIAGKRSQDSTILFTLIANQSKYKTNDKKLQDITTTVGSASKDELRRLIADY